MSNKKMISIPEDLHRDLKIAAAQNNTTLGGFIQHLFRFWEERKDA